MNSKNNILNWLEMLTLSAVNRTGNLVGFIICGWIVSLLIFQYSDTWLIVTSMCTILFTLLLVFLTQKKQIKNVISMQLKLSKLVEKEQGKDK